MSRNDHKIGQELRLQIEEGVWPRVKLEEHPDLIQMDSESNIIDPTNIWEYTRANLGIKEWEWLLLELSPESWDSISEWLTKLGVSEHESVVLKDLNILALHTPSIQCVLDLLLERDEVLQITLSSDEFGIQK